MLNVEALHKQYVTDTGAVDALRGISFEVQPGEIYTLLGPSGCGKSTTLRAVAGLEVPNAGQIVIGDNVVYSREMGINRNADRRGVGMVFQSYAIWPHMTVFDNVAFPLRHGNFKVPKNQVRDMTTRALELVHLESMANRSAPLLSGGQQQRVALARALVYQPSVLLLDEPLSNLDAKLRVEMRGEIQSLIKQLGLTGLYVTHDQEEALAISDRIAVMNDGLIDQEGTPDEVYNHPVNAFVAGFVGKSNFLRGRVAEVTPEDLRMAYGGSVISAGRQASPDALKVGDDVLIMVRHEDVVAHNGQVAPPPNSLPAKLVKVTFLGGRSHCEFEIDGLPFEAEFPGRSNFSAGDTFHVELPPDSVRVFAHDERDLKRLAEQTDQSSATMAEASPSTG